MMYFPGKAGTTIWENLRLQDRAVPLVFVLASGRTTKWEFSGPHLCSVFDPQTRVVWKPQAHHLSTAALCCKSVLLYRKFLNPDFLYMNGWEKLLVALTSL